MWERDGLWSSDRKLTNVAMIWCNHMLVPLLKFTVAVRTVRINGKTLRYNRGQNQTNKPLPMEASDDQ